MSIMEGRPSVLIAEHELIVARDIEQQLQELGYQVLAHVTQAEQALALAAELRPTLVVMEVSLAVPMDGLTAGEAISAQFGIPVIFLTGFSRDDIAERAKLGPTFNYLEKPFVARELRSVIEIALYKRQTELQLSEEMALNRTILENILDSVISIDAQGAITSFNLAACTLFGYAAQEVLGQNVTLLMPEPHRSHHDRYLANYQASGQAHVLGHPRELQGRRKDGSLFPLQLTVSPISNVQRARFIGVIRDLTQRHADDDALHRLSYHDALTGLPNRRMLLDNIKMALLAAARSGRHAALMFLDVDHFKQVNDTLGHGVGDELLQQVASRLQSCLRATDSVARLGGDNFVILLEALSTEQHEAASQAQNLANMMLVALRHAYHLSEHVVTGSASIGIVVFAGTTEESPDQLLKMADIAMSQAKSSGRNHAHFFDPAMQAASTARLTLERDLRLGLANKEFVLHYQLQVDCDGLATGVEALVRWHHPQRGMVPPGEFIPLAEENGVILALGQWVLEEACAQLVKWAVEPRTACWSIAVNVSSRQFSQANFVENVTRALRHAGANPALLKLELTESMLVDDVPGIIRKMNAIKALGVHFSLDDFGTGYSSLCYLKRLPIDQLKIDQSFVRDLETDASDAVIVRTILALGHHLGLKVIAEGVETAEQRDLLAAMGCDAFQGYFFGRPDIPDNLTSSLPKRRLPAALHAELMQ